MVDTSINRRIKFRQFFGVAGGSECPGSAGIPAGALTVCDACRPVFSRGRLVLSFSRLEDGKKGVSNENLPGRVHCVGKRNRGVCATAAHLKPKLHSQCDPVIVITRSNNSGIEAGSQHFFRVCVGEKSED